MNTTRIFAAFVSIACAILFALSGCQTNSKTLNPAHQSICADLPRHYQCPRTDGTIQIDGRIDESAWQNAQWSTRFVDIQGDEFPTPPYQTRFKMLWDDRYLYIAAFLQDPHVWATLSKHDQIVFHDNDFEFFIDPNGDGENYYEVEINALGTIFDLFLVKRYLDGGPALHDWNMKGMYSAVHIDGTINNARDFDRGWSVEFAVPWFAFGNTAGSPLPPRTDDTWRMNFSRVQWQHRIDQGRYVKVPDTPEDNWVWSPQGEINMHLPDRWGYVHFRTK